jgi:hypothetical protein
LAFFGSLAEKAQGPLAQLLLSTPVIDPSTHIMYLVACTLENSTMAYRLHAVDITSGAEPYGSGVLISGSYGGSTFDARYQTQRVSPALSGNQIVFGFAAIELEYAGGYVGWVMAYNKLTGILYVLNTANLGKESPADSGAVQTQTILVSEIRGGPVYWQRSAANGGPLLYNWGACDWVKAYRRVCLGPRSPMPGPRSRSVRPARWTR